jgi:hypothetical protein
MDLLFSLEGVEGYELVFGYGRLGFDFLGVRFSHYLCVWCFMCLMRLTEQVEICNCIRRSFIFGAIFYDIYVPSNDDLDSTNALYAIGPPSTLLTSVVQHRRDMKTTITEG